MLRCFLPPVFFSIRAVFLSLGISQSLMSPVSPTCRVRFTLIFAAVLSLGSLGLAVHANTHSSDIPRASSYKHCVSFGQESTLVSLAPAAPLNPHMLVMLT